MPNRGVPRMLGLGSPPRIFAPAVTGRDDAAARFSLAEFRDANGSWLAADAGLADESRSPKTGWISQRLQRLAATAERVAGIFL